MMMDDLNWQINDVLIYTNKPIIDYLNGQKMIDYLNWQTNDVLVYTYKPIFDYLNGQKWSII